MDILIDIKEVNKKDLIYLMQVWLREYFQVEDNEESQLWAKKIIDALRMKIEGVDILYKPIADDLEKAFLEYTTAKLNFKKNMHEYSYDNEEDEAALATPRNNIINAFKVAIFILQLLQTLKSRIYPYE